MIALLSHWTTAWSELFSNSAPLRTAVDFAHIAGLLAAGGAAIAVDRATLKAARGDAATRAAHVRALHASHRGVLIGLSAVAVSGVLLFAADLDTFLYSKVFWLKMALLALLLVNGAILVRAGGGTNAEQTNWRVLRTGALASLVLWFLTTLAGAALPNVG
jgi:hypothetical protein